MWDGAYEQLSDLPIPGLFGDGIGGCSQSFMQQMKIVYSMAEQVVAVKVDHGTNGILSGTSQ